MTKFKVGDRVRYVGGENSLFWDDIPVGALGTIGVRPDFSAWSGPHFYIDHPADGMVRYPVEESEIEHVVTPATHYLRTAHHYAGAPIGTIVDGHGPLGTLPDRGFRKLGPDHWQSIDGLESNYNGSHLAGARRRIRQWGAA